MAIITTPNPTLGTPQTITLNRADLMTDLQTVHGSGGYFTTTLDYSKWNKVVITIQSSVGGQTKTLIFDGQSNSTAELSLSTTARATDWQVQNAVIYDFDGGSISITRKLNQALLSPYDFDVRYFHDDLTTDIDDAYLTISDAAGSVFVYDGSVTLTQSTGGTNPDAGGYFFNAITRATNLTIPNLDITKDITMTWKFENIALQGTGLKYTIVIAGNDGAEGEIQDFVEGAFVDGPSQTISFKSLASQTQRASMTEIWECKIIFWYDPVAPAYTSDVTLDLVDFSVVQSTPVV